MIHKHILNGLTLSLMLSLISTPAHAGWLSSISNYFNQPSKNALVVTTAALGVSLIATVTCAWNWWKKSKALVERERLALAADAEKEQIKKEQDCVTRKHAEELKILQEKLKQPEDANSQNRLLEQNIISKIALENRQLKQKNELLNQVNRALFDVVVYNTTPQHSILESHGS